MALKEQFEPKVHYFKKVRKVLSLSNRLRRLACKGHYYTYEQLAHDLGVTKQTIFRLINIDYVSEDFIKRLEQLENETIR